MSSIAYRTPMIRAMFGGADSPASEGASRMNARPTNRRAGTFEERSWRIV